MNIMGGPFIPAGAQHITRGVNIQVGFCYARHHGQSTCAMQITTTRGAPSKLTTRVLAEKGVLVPVTCLCTAAGRCVCRYGAATEDLRQGVEC